MSPLWLSQTSSQLNDSSHLPRLNEVCCRKPMSCHSSALPACHLPMPSLHLSVPQYSSLENFPNGSSGGSHNVWATSLNTETICLGPAPMIPSPETSGEDRSNPCHSSLLTKQTGTPSREKTQPHLLHIPRGAPFHRLPPELGHQVGQEGPRTEDVKGQRMSAIPVTVTSSELPSKEAN